MNIRCIDCPAIGNWGKSGRCDTHRKQKQRIKDRSPERRQLKAKYDNSHRRERKLWEKVVNRGIAICPRCGETIRPDQIWDLGHQSGGGYSLPEHAYCNRAAANDNRRTR